MNVRGLLQFELWSKKTSRKILVGIGIVFGLLLVCLICWYEVEIHWITPGERDAARAALKEIDAIEDAGPLSEQELKVRTEQGEAMVKLAEAAAQTHRDNSIRMDLDLYLVGVEMERSKVYGEKNQSPEIQAVLTKLKSNHRLTLHKALD